MNETHDAKAKSWVQSANVPQCDFPLQNLPFGVFRRQGGNRPHVGVAIGDQVFDAAAWMRDQGENAPDLSFLGAPVLNPLLAAGPKVWSAARRTFFRMLREDAPERERLSRYLLNMGDVEMLLPVQIGDYTDFYASIHHASNVGSMFRPGNALLPNYKWVPVGYHGRASSIAVSGTAVHRPSGQTKPPDSEAPTFGPSRQLDYELEVGAVIGLGNELRDPIPVSRAREHVFGYCLVNDWSARDIQSWEYQPLGPFLAKNFLTSVSPWIVTSETLEPFRAPALGRERGDPKPLPHLWDDEDQRSGGLEIVLEVSLSSREMRERGIPAMRLSRGDFRSMYWTFAQMIAHHTSNGCNLHPGDLLASGTVSGPTPDSRGCMLELTWRGNEPLQLPSGEKRTFLEDGDEVVFRGYCERDGFARIGFGECRGTITG